MGHPPFEDCRLHGQAWQTKGGRTLTNPHDSGMWSGHLGVDTTAPLPYSGVASLLLVAAPCDAGCGG
jgi:hypothetical protein